MLEQKFEIVYTKFKLHFYQEIFERFQNQIGRASCRERVCLYV